MQEIHQETTCCFEPISVDLQNRLNEALCQVDELKKQNEYLSNELNSKTKEISNLLFRQKELESENKNVIDHSTILSAKIDLLKAELKKNKFDDTDLKREITLLSNKNKELMDVLTTASKKINRYKSTQKQLIEHVNDLNNNNNNNEMTQQLEEYKSQLSNYENIVREQEVYIKNLILTKKELKKRIRFYTDKTNENKEKEKNLKNDLLSEISQYKIQIDHLKNDNQMLNKQNESLQEVLKQKNNIESENDEIKQSLNKIEHENHILKQNIEEYKSQITKLNEEIKNKIDLENKISSLTSKLETVPEYEKLNENLNEEIKSLNSSINVKDLQISKLSEQIENLKYVASEQENIKSAIAQFEFEIQEREMREQKLSKKYRYYKNKAREQLEIINGFQEKTNDINNELMRIKEKEARKEAALRRKERQGIDTDLTFAKMSRDLLNEKTKNLRLEMKMHNFQRKISDREKTSIKIL